MKWLSFSLIVAGLLCLVYSARHYYQTLAFMQTQSYAGRVFQSPLNSLSFLIILLFIPGFAATGFFVLYLPYTASRFLVAGVFFCSGLFVLSMVRSARRMAESIADKTLEMMHIMVNSIEAKDLYTKGHSEHVMHLSELLYSHLPAEQREQIDPGLLRDAALLHDIGKIGIPDSILNKPGRLTDDEMAVIRHHPWGGATILQDTSYGRICDWVLYHHERLDGAGYYKLPGKQIPLEARILAVADTFSALYSDRSYRAALPYDQAIEVLRGAAGAQLDPELVAVFCTIPQSAIDRIGVQTFGRMI